MADGEQFDVGAARKAGYTDDQILTHLRGTTASSFDVDGALKAGYSKSDVIGELAKGGRQPAIPGAPNGLPPVPGSPTPTSSGRMVPPINMQPSYGMQAATGAPLMSMQPGLPAPAQVPENLRAMQGGALVGSMIANPAATIGAVTGGYLGQAGAGKAAKSAGLGETGQTLARFGGGAVGSVLGGTAGAIGGAGVKNVYGGKVWTKQPDGTWEMDPWAEALTFGTKLGKAMLEHIAEKPATDQAMADTYAAQRSIQQAAARRAIEADMPLGQKELISQGPTAPQHAAVRAAQAQVARLNARQFVPVSQTPIPDVPTQPGPTQGPQQSNIVLPGSEPPAVKVTYQSVSREQLYDMARKGDIQAGLELIRNPKGFELPPNFKYLIEATAKKIPWRNNAE